MVMTGDQSTIPLLSPTECKRFLAGAKKISVNSYKYLTIGFAMDGRIQDKSIRIKIA